MTQSSSSLQQVGHWQGNLDLTFAAREGAANRKTILQDSRHNGPFTVQRPFYPEDGVCHVILLHPPGGLVEGDSLTLNVTCNTGSHALLTTPSAGKVYECSQHAARQTQNLILNGNSVLEWFPQETILYQNALAELTTKVQLSDSAQYAGWEIVCLGRPISEDYFTRGRFTQAIEIYRDDQPVLLERVELCQDEDRQMQQHPWLLAGYCAVATLILTGANAEHLEQARAIVTAANEKSQRQALQAGITLLDDVLVCRALAQQSRVIKGLFVELWSHLREPIYGRPACIPRIWST